MPIDYVAIPSRLRSLPVRLAERREFSPDTSSSIQLKKHGIGSGQVIRRKDDGSLEYHRDDLTIEEPLEIRARRERREKHALRSYRGFVLRTLAPRASPSNENKISDGRAALYRLHGLTRRSSGLTLR